MNAPIVPHQPRDESSGRLCLSLAGLVMVALVAFLFSGCGSTATPTATPPPPYLSLVPCGGSAQMESDGSSDWVTLDTQVTVNREVRVRTEADSTARLCLGDRSLIELAPGSVAEIRPSQDGSRLELALERGSLRVLAYERSYQVATSACPVTVSDVPARIRLEQAEGTTRVRVEEGSAVCASAADPTLLPTCWELVVGPGEASRVGEYCGTAEEPRAGDGVTPTSPVGGSEPAAPAEATPSPGPTSIP